MIRNSFGPRPEEIRYRLRHRLHQRYLRWLARQPVTSFCRSPGWRSFWRSYRRRTNAVFASRLVVTAMGSLAVCVLLLILVVVAWFGAAVAQFLPGFFFEPPEGHAFADSAERAAVAMTRLAVFQSVVLPLLFFWASRCFCNDAKQETRNFYKRFSSSGLIAYRTCFLCCLACSAMVSVGATIGHGATGYGIAASLTTTACLGWLAWTAAKRLMGVQYSPWLWSSQELAAASFGLLALLMPAVVASCYGSAVLSVSQNLKWLGPFGWLNDLLLGLGFGHTQNLLPLGICWALALYLGFRLNRPTATWAFRRGLLLNYRTRETRRRATTSKASELHAARDLREALSGNDWKSILYPRWIRGRVRLLLFLCGTVFAMQLILAGLVLFLETIEREAGQALDEKRQMCLMLSFVAGWNVLLMEGFAVCFRDQSDLLEFARRPVSPGHVWRQLQLRGARFAPAQTLCAIPFITLTIVIAPGHTANSCITVGLALLACVAIRTVLVAGACYFVSIANLRQWIAFVLLGIGMVVGGFVIFGTAANITALCMDPDWTPGAMAFALLLQQIATLTALGMAWGVWCVIARSGKETQLLPAAGQP